MKLTRTDYLETGIFGLLDPIDGHQIFTLEHAYPVVPDSSIASTSYSPKVLPGTYLCVRGTHQLSNGVPFETFEVIVPGHTGILFHPGNTNKDSEGCILLGLSRSGDNAIAESRPAFALFMLSLAGVNSFNLEIV